VSGSRLEEVRAHLHSEYAGVFAPGQVDAHVEEYVALEPTRPLVEQVAGRLRPGATILDIGCGYGSFVTEATLAGFDARGIDAAPFEIAFARERLAELGPGRSEDAFVIGDGQELPFAAGSFDAVTLWNVVEHVPNTAALLAQAERVLAPGGWLFVIAPNYAAFRREAHYHVPWAPLLPRRMASRYLRARGRDPRFFEASIFYCTNRGVRRELRNLGLEIVDRRAERLSKPDQIENPSVRRVVSALAKVGLAGVAPAVARTLAANPLAATISLEARKPATSASARETP
jgi:MPBQ/MSBQ methyltransferase